MGDASSLGTMRGIRLAITVLLLATCAAAQEVPERNVVPERIIDEQQAAKDKRGSVSGRIFTAPLLPLRFIGGGMRKGLLWAEDRGWHLKLSPLETPDTTTSRQGFVPLYGGFDIGAGWAGGVKYYRNDFPFRGVKLEVPVRVSTNLYRELAVNLVRGPDSRLPVEFGVSYRGRPQDDFFGLGPFSNEFARSNYDLVERSVYLRPTWRISRTVSLITHARMTSTSVFDGSDPISPGTRERFDTPGANIPGILGARMLVAGALLQHDNRPTAGMPWTGGLESAGVSWHEGLGRGDFAYWKFRAELMRFLPLASKRRVLAFHVMGEANSPRGGSEIPFFDQAILGGGPTMRGFREFRFYDRAGALATAEYRFQLNAWMAAFLFVDEGQVARRPGDFHWRNWRTSYGGGFRFFTARSAVLNVSAGASAEGIRFYMVFAPRF